MIILELGDDEIYLFQLCDIGHDSVVLWWPQWEADYDYYFIRESIMHSQVTYQNE